MDNFNDDLILTTLENFYNDFGWFEKVTRKMNESDRAICLEFYAKVSKHLTILENELMESQMLTCQLLNKKKAIERCLPYNKGKFDEVLKQILND